MKQNPLRYQLSPRTAAIAGAVLGYVCLLMPWGYLTVTLQDAVDSSPLIIWLWGASFPYHEIGGCINTSWEWSSDTAAWVFKAQTFLGLPTALRTLPLIYPLGYLLHYLARSGKPTAGRLIAFFFGMLALALAMIVAPVLLVERYNPQPAPHFCADAPHVLIHGSTIYWLAALVWLAGLMFGFYALARKPVPSAANPTT